MKKTQTSTLKGNKWVAEVYAPEEMRIRDGRAFLDSETKTLEFRENAPRNPRSTEVCRTTHGRCVKRYDNTYSIRVVFCPGTSRSRLIAEFRKMVDIAGAESTVVRGITLDMRGGARC